MKTTRISTYIFDSVQCMIDFTEFLLKSRGKARHFLSLKYFVKSTYFSECADIASTKVSKILLFLTLYFPHFNLVHYMVITEFTLTCIFYKIFVRATVYKRNISQMRAKVFILLLCSVRAISKSIIMYVGCNHHYVLHNFITFVAFQVSLKRIELKLGSCNWLNQSRNVRKGAKCVIRRFFFRYMYKLSKQSIIGSVLKIDCSFA